MSWGFRFGTLDLDIYSIIFSALDILYFSLVNPLFPLVLIIFHEL